MAASAAVIAPVNREVATARLALASDRIRFERELRPLGEIA